MSTGKYLSLEEARQHGLLDRFCKENPRKGREVLFDKLMDAMAKPEEEKQDNKTKTE